MLGRNTHQPLGRGLEEAGFCQQKACFWYVQPRLRYVGRASWLWCYYVPVALTMGVGGL
jgi:hypothetical protein